MNGLVMSVGGDSHIKKGGVPVTSRPVLTFDSNMGIFSK